MWTLKERDEIRALMSDGIKYTADDGYANHNHELRNGSYIYAFYYEYRDQKPIDIDVHLGDTQIPTGYRYCEWATGSKANFNEELDIPLFMSYAKRLQ